MFVCTDRHLFKFMCVLLIFIVCASGDYDTRESESLSENGGERTPQDGNDNCIGNNCVKRTINSSPGAMWFGPRLGRRRRSGRKTKVNNKEVENIAEAINTSPWAFVSIPGEKRQSTQFTPRLGRELVEELLYGELEDISNQVENQDMDDEVRLRRFFTSRLGRQALFLPPPRLGRQLQKILARI
ncbi:PBAN-type neuropeptides-like [Belonocnema kinseyi]|uniref:PBAN-type neuropeptides-like n=1 Tax=Belonocnema kinseyi TaxID=2817044 RepID=UPI00143D76BD|nr:PBAN-type neuropeptides-like [Belonocnema kinseyi]